MDKQTAKRIRVSDEIKNMVKSSGWSEVRSLLLDKMIDLNDITNVTEIDPTKLMILLAAKQEAVRILSEWLMEVEGIAKNADAIKEQMRDKIKADFLIQFNDSEQGDY